MEHRVSTPAILSILVILSFAFLVSSCEKIAETGKPQQYKGDGFSFTYPGNWNISEDVDEEGMRYLIVESPGNAIFLAQVYDEETAPDLDTYAQWYSDQAKTQMPFGTAEPGKRTKNERRIDGELRSGLYERFDVRLAGTRTPQILEYYRVDSGGKAYILVSFVPDTDLDQVSPGFDQIFGSFVTEKSESGDEADSDIFEEEPEATPFQHRSPWRDPDEEKSPEN